VSELEAAGARVVARQADVSLRPEVLAILDDIRHQMPPLRGIIHSAGTVDDAPLLSQTWMRFANVFAAKVHGSWNLHTLTLDRSLDFFALFSTAVSVLGSAGQANHAAANAFLDALAHYRRAAGLPALSINWGPWGEVGAAANARVAELLKARGIMAMTPQQGLIALDRCLAQRSVQVAVFGVNWHDFLTSHAGSRELPVFQDFYQEILAAERNQARQESRSADGTVEQDKKTALQRSELAQRLRQASAGDRWELLRAHVEREVASVLGLNQASPMDPELGFFQMGMDSLMSVELRGRLAFTLGAPLPATVVFNYPTIESLTRHLITEVLALETNVTESSRGSEYAARETSDLQHLSHEKVGELLDQELESLGELAPE